MNIKASIDIGSNSILLLGMKFSDQGKEVVLNESNVTGLGRDLDKNGRFIDVAMEESFEVLKNYVKKCVNFGIKPKDIMATATEASRVASNSNDFYNKVYNELGLKVYIINGKGEAYYSSIGILCDDRITDEEITIMDIGGASTELIRVNVLEKRIIHSFSMPVGAVRMNNWYKEAQRESKLEDVVRAYIEDIERVKSNKLYCVAGTMTSVGNIYLNNKTFIEDEVNGLNFSTNELVEILKKYSSYTADEFLETFPFLGKRSKTISSGLVLAKRLILQLGVRDLFISTYGLRYGTILVEEIPEEFLS